MPAKPITDAEHIAEELFRCAKIAWNGIVGASHPPPIRLPTFLEEPDWHGQLDRYGLVVELVLKHRLACRRMPAVGDDGPSSREILNEAKWAGHNAQDVFGKLDGPTQKPSAGLRQMRRRARRVRRADRPASGDIQGDAVVGQEMSADAVPLPRTGVRGRAVHPAGGEWSPKGSTAGRELPSFPGRLVDWAETEFDKIKPERTTSETIEAVCDRIMQPR